MRISRILVWRDSRWRDPAVQMALDEAVFRHTVSTGVACARFYSWEKAAMTLGYFHRGPLPDPMAIRRYTGGGVVEHGEDLTFLLTVPAGSELSQITATERYRWLHERIARALIAAGSTIRLSGEVAETGSGPCFVHPVPWDLLEGESGQKIGGGAQRRSRGAVIHQGSLRLPETLRSPQAGWIAEMLENLAESPEEMPEAMQDELIRDAERLVEERYGKRAWNEGEIR